MNCLRHPLVFWVVCFGRARGGRYTGRQSLPKSLQNTSRGPHAINEKLTPTQPEPLSLCYWSPSAHKVFLCAIGHQGPTRFYSLLWLFVALLSALERLIRSKESLPLPMSRFWSITVLFVAIFSLGWKDWTSDGTCPFLYILKYTKQKPGFRLVQSNSVLWRHRWKWRKHIRAGASKIQMWSQR